MHSIDELFNLRNKMAVVIGGGGVLAGAMACGLASAGASIAVIDLNLTNAEKTADQVGRFEVKSLALAADATSKDDLKKAGDHIE
ncbi:MAG: SDR family NAD(P)-dependent oxidoreductase, partial [Calditrichaeota bacterium]